MENAAVPLRQLLYASASTDELDPMDTAKIVAQSRRNNGMDGVTGLLWTDSERFLQVLEGPSDSISLTFDRIKSDSRHRGVVVLHDRKIEARQFGYWTMASRSPTDSADEFDVKLNRLLEGASDTVRGMFEGLVAARA